MSAMFDDTKKPAEPPAPEAVTDPIDDEMDLPITPAPAAPPLNPAEEFPEKVACNQCRRVFATKELRAKSNTLLTEAAIICPRCRRKLHKMRLKDWYDRYVQGQERDFKLDPHDFFHVDPPGYIPDGAIVAQNNQPAPAPQGPNRGGGRRRGRDRGRNRGGNPNQQPQDSRQEPQRPKSRLPQNVKAFRLPRRRKNKER